ncbi:dTDP-glucose 4,6-dehydratase [Micromonospora globispora]|uniref:dTDP-glucose 4,6-dehydratase n=1 Tax=Micromonospora globispora TaxID=1450148 RepID=A0A317KL84_9ACTN|nr:dTDP-glucose 4,6-dehydratase [Micromonospora globispora]PWU52584.1 dTDP-glucose 4,6-dehydratase [Micromonospora globispora]PWU57891.1 dTDP-glucose 4,6-dehydratase [Micromonospora globispora]RQW90382.1 dTDP-glucose 4,6-dehydratase [Micromonospora globispora]
MRILVTGGAGFIGSAYVRRLLTGAEPAVDAEAVTVLDKFTYAGTEGSLAPVRADPRLRVVRGDICDAPLVDATLAGHDVVVHFAAESHVDRSITGPAAFVTTNVLGTQTLLDAALRHGVRRFVQVSTDEVYGSIAIGSWTEGDPLDPSSPYSASKAAADLLALAYHRTHGLDVLITRGANTYGPYQYPEKIVPLFVTNLLDGHDVPLYGDGGNIREWLHVDDHCRGIALAQTRGRAGGIYHLGGATELTNRELTGRLLVACGAGWERVRPVADRKGHDRRYSLDITTSRHELGWSPTVDLDKGLAATVDWYRENRAWWAPLKPHR